MIAGLIRLREMFDGMKPIFGVLFDKAKEVDALPLAFSTAHLISSVEVFQQELEKYVMEKVNESDT